MTSVSAVIVTYERPDKCERALVSVLEQDPKPLEILVCDDGSADGTQERFRSWEARDNRVRYLRLEPNRGTPGPARNLGVAAALGDWVAFLDDDDAWLPGKLAAQLEWASDADVLGTNARTTTGELYFPQTAATWRPTRDELLHQNPVICSSALVRREVLVKAGGFPEARWLRGIEDYAAWLALADHGARLLVLGEPLVYYTSDSSERFSTDAVRVAAAGARLAWRRALTRPLDRSLLRAAANHTAGAAHTLTRRSV
jgi:glycosyltransferase involved in cell wall biosynthesis